MAPVHECKHENRISKLEGESMVNGAKIDNLIQQLETLTDEVKWMVRLAFTSVLGACTTVVWYVITTKLTGG